MPDDTLFQCPGLALAAREIQRPELPQVQAFFEANPAYWQLVNGRLPHADEAAVDFDERPPPHLPYRAQHFIGLFDAQGALAGVTIIVSDLGSAGVWHVSLFIVATALHGTGTAERSFRALEAWIAGQGADWLRLGVVTTNERALRFWQRMGFTPLRVREGVDTGGRLNDVRVMAKPLRPGADLADYLLRVPRDQAGSTLP